ncbi:TetR/AcrR family transcriptional regulator [Microbacterium sp. ZW T5_45]|uniref:TetR/AcrR family transcriptional regulator n=1 Tax=Microbacterium sp. ZW T5_45 TaxID=3378080 RepID=UPI00385292AC
MTGKRGRPSAAERLERHERVVDVVIRMLIDHGYDAVTFDRISAEAHVAKRTLYADFGDRSGLVRAAVRRQHPTDPSAGDLRAAAIEIIAHLLSDEAIGIHRAIIAAADAALAAEFYDEGPARAQRILADRIPDPDAAPILFAALLGEPHRRRLLGLSEAPDAAQVEAHVDATLALLELGPVRRAHSD